jgi:hypothetical protein
MKRDGMLFSETHEGHDVRNASAISGALIGGTAGILGGLAGIGAAGLVGAMIGALGGLVLERQTRRIDEHDAEDAKAASLIEPPCADCVEVQVAGGDAGARCPHHAKRRHLVSHLHYTYPQSLPVGSMLFRPTF